MIYDESLSSIFVTNIEQLKRFVFENLSLQIFSGNVQRDLKLNFEEGTEVYGSCGATLNGQHWIIGGKYEKRQVSHLQKTF